MKKIFLLLLVIGSSYGLTAQVANTMDSTNHNSGALITATAYASLPVLETAVSPDIVSKLESKYGSSLYDITAVQGASSTGYVIRVFENGVYQIDYVGEDGNAYKE
jgi:hypothetical protein